MARFKDGLSKKLLTRVLSVYFTLTLIVTAGQIFTEYLATKKQIQDELQTLKNTFHSSLTRAMWEVNLEQAKLIAIGLLELPIVEGVQIRNENDEFIANLGQVPEEKTINRSQIGQLANISSGLFGYTFPLVFEFSGRTSNVGNVTLYSSFGIIFNRIEVGIFFLIGNAIIKTAFLVFLFMAAFRRMLSEPLNTITHQMMFFDPERPQNAKITFVTEDDNELRQLGQSYNQVIDDLIKSQNKLRATKDDLKHAYTKLDEQNMLLEQEVAKKTASLSQIMLDLERQKEDLLSNQRELRQEIDNRKYIEDELRRKNTDLAESMRTVDKTQEQLVESERMASLGGLVAGITHDINTPLGVGVTAASFLHDKLHRLKTSIDENKLTKTQLEDFMREADQTATLLLTNLNRASDLIASFKQVAVDQTSEAERNFNLKEYLDEIMQSLAPSIKHAKHHISINCPIDIQVLCAPGAIAQIITNMIMNSIQHAYSSSKLGNIVIEVEQVDEMIHLHYEDDGSGVDKETIEHLFDAFYTTKQDEGGSGLGTHIIYNLVTQTLNGSISATSELGHGLKYDIRFPKRN